MLETSATLPHLPPICDTDEDDIADANSSHTTDPSDYDVCAMDYNNCSYALTLDSGSKADTVIKCSSPHCHCIQLCTDCVARGAHKRHKKYLKDDKIK